MLKEGVNGVAKTVAWVGAGTSGANNKQ